MNNIIINGTQSFMGKEIPVIEGGFGEGKKVILAKTIAEIHDVEVKKVNELINKNLNEFDFGIDILDLKQVDKKDLFLENNLFTKRNGEMLNIFIY